ncbi:hypothetical protein SEA_KLEIN_207 [Mycobacterium phage Klein]|nr:hypothetical protein SEA_KLEIN_207 [Mycobacterium phage Klein]
MKYRYVLKTRAGELFSEPTEACPEPRELWIKLGDAGRYLERIESNDGNGWATV